MFKQIVANLLVLAGFVLCTLAGWHVGPSWGYAVAGILAVLVGICIHRSG